MDTKESNKEESKREDSPALADLELSTPEGEEIKGAVVLGRPIYVHMHVIEDVK